MVEFIRENQVLVLFAGILVAGLVVLLPSIQLALQGDLGALRLIVIALVAMVVSDMAWYVLGWLVPSERLRKTRLFASASPLIERMSSGFAQTRSRLLFFSRLLYGTRIPTCIACGLARMSLGSFLAVNLASALLWLAILFSFAAVFGSTLDQLSGGVSDPRLAPALLVLVALLIQGVMRRTRARAHARPRHYETLVRVSVVIPAYNEQAFLEAAIRSVRQQPVKAEVIVVENGSTDGTAEIARRLADGVAQTEAPLGYSRARNLGAAIAHGEILVFLDADSRMGPDALRWILAKVAPETFGTVLGRPDPPHLRYRLFFLAKNLWHRLGLYHGVLGGLLFCDAQLFRQLGGFDEKLVFDELHEFSARARRSGATYRLASRVWSATSMRRFEREGLWSSLKFWIRVRVREAMGLGPCERSLAYASFSRSAPPRKDAIRAPVQAHVELP
jgi:membrane protein DedA with SNARE-associated domain